LESKSYGTGIGSHRPSSFKAHISGHGFVFGFSGRGVSLSEDLGNRFFENLLDTRMNTIRVVLAYVVPDTCPNMRK